MCLHFFPEFYKQFLPFFEYKNKITIIMLTITIIFKLMYSEHRTENNFLSEKKNCSKKEDVFEAFDGKIDFISGIC